MIAQGARETKARQHRFTFCIAVHMLDILTALETVLF
jgi:hypothetical protein